MREKILTLLSRHREILSYLFWGVMTTVVSWGSYTVFSLLLRNVSGWELTVFGRGFSLTILTANILSWVCAVLFAFVTNKRFVFRSKSWERSVAWPEFLKFISSRAATGILEIVAVPALVAAGLSQTILGIEGMLAKVLVSFVVVLLNYILSKLFIFRGRKSE